MRLKLALILISLFKKEPGSFTLAGSSGAVPLIISVKDFPGVLRVTRHLQGDINKVTDSKPEIILDTFQSKEIILIGTLGNNKLIDKLVKEDKLNVKNISGKWETFLIRVVENPFPDVNRALVIAGSDKRGTIYLFIFLSDNELQRGQWFTLWNLV